MRLECGRCVEVRSEDSSTSLPAWEVKASHIDAQQVLRAPNIASSCPSPPREVLKRRRAKNFDVDPLSKETALGRWTKADHVPRELRTREPVDVTS